MASTKKKKSNLGPTLKDIFKKAGMSVAAVADEVGVNKSTIHAMLYGGTGSIQRDLALKVSRATKSDAKVLEPYLAERVPHGVRKKRKINALKKLAEVFTVTCPHCEGEGTISVRKI